jgi:hypothetical protein
MTDLNEDFDAKEMVEQTMLKAMSRSEAGRAAANARWAGKRKTGKAPQMVEGGWRTAAGIPKAEQKSNARSKAGMQGARTRAQNKESKNSATAIKESLALIDRAAELHNAGETGKAKALLDQATKTVLSVKGDPEVDALPGRERRARREVQLAFDKRTTGKQDPRLVGNPDGSGEVVSSRKIKRDEEVAQLSPAQQAKYKERMDTNQNLPPSKSFPASPTERRHQDALIFAQNYKAPKAKRPKKFE